MIIDTSSGPKHLYTGKAFYGIRDASTDILLESKGTVQVVIGEGEEDCIQKMHNWIIQDLSIGLDKTFQLFNIQLEEPIVNI